MGPGPPAGQLYHRYAQLSFRPLLPQNTHNRCFMDALLPLLLSSRILASVEPADFTRFVIPDTWRPELKGICSMMLGRDVTDYRYDEYFCTANYDALAVSFLTDERFAWVDKESPDKFWLGNTVISSLNFLQPLIHGHGTSIEDYCTGITCTGTCSMHGKVTSKHYFDNFFLGVDPFVGFPLVLTGAGIADHDNVATLELEFSEMKNFTEVQKEKIRTCQSAVESTILGSLSSYVTFCH